MSRYQWPMLWNSADLSAADAVIDELVNVLKSLKLTLPGIPVIEGC